MIKPFIASLINAFLLISLGAWGYLASETPSFTALIPVALGILLLIFNKGLKNDNKIAAHLVVLLTFIVLIGLLKPFSGALSRSDIPAITRVIIMMISSIYALITFIKSFIDVRKQR